MTYASFYTAGVLAFAIFLTRFLLLCCARKLTHFPLSLLYLSALTIPMHGKSLPSSVGFSVTINGDTIELRLKPLQVRQQEVGEGEGGLESVVGRGGVGGWGRGGGADGGGGGGRGGGGGGGWGSYEAGTVARFSLINCCLMPDGGDHDQSRSVAGTRCLTELFLFSDLRNRPGRLQRGYSTRD